MGEQQDKAYAQLEKDLLDLAKKYTDIFPKYDMPEHCPVENCNVAWPYCPKDAKHCHIHGDRFVRGKFKLSVAQVLDEISTSARLAREDLEKHDS